MEPCFQLLFWETRGILPGMANVAAELPGSQDLHSQLRGDHHPPTYTLNIALLETNKPINKTTPPQTLTNFNSAETGKQNSISVKL